MTLFCQCFDTLQLLEIASIHSIVGILIVGVVNLRYINILEVTVELGKSSAFSPPGCSPSLQTGDHRVHPGPLPVFALS